MNNPAVLKSTIPLIVLLDDVRSMHNVGSLFRSADVFGLEAVWLCGITGRPPHRDIRKTALGADETVPWQYFENSSLALEALKAKSYPLLALELDPSSKDIGAFQPEQKTGYGLVLGHEVKGVKPAIIEAADQVLEIAQFGEKNSLNVSVAGGIALYHLSTRMRLKNR